MIHEVDGVDYDNCIVCNREIISTKAKTCLKCKDRPKENQYERISGLSFERFDRGDITW